jgi:hypothetical protein
MPRLLFVVCALALVACDQRPSARIGGDPGGVPVTVSVTYDREALEPLTSSSAFVRTIVIERDPFYGGIIHGSHRHYPGYGYVGGGWYGPPMRYEPATSITLLVGRGPAEAQYLRAPLVNGVWEWPLRITADTEVVVSLQAQGGRSGWKEIGRFTAAAQQQIAVALVGAEPRLTVTTAP